MFKSKDSVIRKIVAKNNGNIEITSVETNEPVLTSEKIKNLDNLDQILLIKKIDYANTLLTFLNKDNTYNGIRYNPKTNNYTSFRWTTLQGFNFEVYPKDLPKQMNWNDAMKACADLGEGWRLPTKEELNLMYKNKDEIGGFANDYYWSSTEYDTNDAWLQNFNSGRQNNYGNSYYNKDGKCNVRAVRALTI